MKIKGSVWFTSMQPKGTIGIVLIDNGYEEKAYIGLGEGLDQKCDEETIAKVGGKFPVELAKKLILYFYSGER